MEKAPGASCSVRLNLRHLLSLSLTERVVVCAQRDYSYDFFAFKTLERSYLVKLAGKIVER